MSLRSIMAKLAYTRVEKTKYGRKWWGCILVTCNCYWTMTSIEKIITRLGNEGQKFGIVLNPPVSTNELLDLKEKLGVDLPEDILDFYKICNGFESEDHLFRMIPIKEIVKDQNEFINRTFHFAEYLIYSDTWDIRLTMDETGYAIINNNHGTESPTTLCNSLSLFLERYLAGTGVFGESGLYQWTDEIKSSK